MSTNYIERSRTSASYKMAFTLLFIGLGVAFYYSLNLYLTKGIFLLPDFLVEGAAAYYLIRVLKTYYIYELTEDAFVVTEYGMWRKREYVVPYEQIDGICLFKLRLFKALHFRYTYRVYSKLEKRLIWSLVYAVPDNKGTKAIHARLFLKGSDEFFAAFAEKIPGKVQITEDQVMQNAFIREGERLRALGYYGDEEVPVAKESDGNEERKGDN